MHAQTDLFGAGPSYPEGFRYEDDVIDERMEATVLDAIRTLPFREFEFHGYTGKRRVVSFGWHYDFGAEQLERASDIPSFLLALREAAARFAGLVPAALPHVLVTEYAPGAAIGWHRDKGVFDAIVGISLAAPCTFRLRRRRAEG